MGVESRASQTGLVLVVLHSNFALCEVNDPALMFAETCKNNPVDMKK